MAEKICVIVGAGASYDVRNAGSPSGAVVNNPSAVIGNPELRPPLAKHLFDIQGHPAYWTYLREYEGAKVLTQGLAQQSLRGEFNLEGELRRLAEHSSPIIRQHYRHIPVYLRDLIAACSYEYTPVPSCYVTLATVLLEEQPSDVLFLTLNYDDLLEQAIGMLRPQEFLFESLDDYIRDERPAKIVKLHGSISWFKSIGPQNVDWRQQALQSDVLSRAPDNETIVSVQHRRTFQIDLHGYHVYPVLTAPLAGKGIADMVCPASHLEAAREFLIDCRRFMIIGSSGVDADLSELLSTSVKRTGDRTAQFVSGSEPASKASWEAFGERTTIFSQLTVPPGEVAFRGGFVEYTDSGTALRFARA